MTNIVLILSITLIALVFSAILIRNTTEKYKSDEHMRVMFDAMPVCANFWNSNFQLIECNEISVKLFELYSKKEYCERFFELSPEYQPDGRPSKEKLIELVNKTFTEGFCRFEWMHRKLNGELLPCEITLVRFQYRRKCIVVGYTRDLREIKTTLAKMDESKKSLSILTNILNGLDSMIYVTVPNTNELLFVNDSMREHYGIKGDVIGKKCYEVLQDGLKGRCYLCPCPKLDKEPSATVVWEEHSTLTGRIYRNTDRYIEWQEGQIAHIEHSVDVTELIAAKEQAEQSNRFKSQFLSRMSHEIRTPMNAILGITEIQLQDETLPLTIKEAFGRIYNSGDLLLGIINDILDLSKIESGKMELSPAKYEVTSLIHDTVQLNIMRYENKPVKFELDVNENVPLVLIGDEIRIKQILNNLLSNAFKYTNEGMINLSVFIEPENEEKSNVTLVFRVSDTGQGMTAEQVRILGIDEYSRFNTGTNRATQGTGLGMNITRNLIQLMNGKISIESELGKGSVFTVRLPQGDTGTSGVIGSELAENLKLFSLSGAAQIKKTQITREFMPYGRVLVVDDVETNLYVAKGLMAPYGLLIDTVSSGFDAIKRIKDGCEYDVIFMDHMMQKMDGIETVKTLRDMGYTHPIIALTANALIGHANMFLNNGFDGYISKPIDIRHLNVILNKHIRDKQPEDVLERARAQKSRLHSIGFNLSAKDPQLAEIFINDANKTIKMFETIYKNRFRRADDISIFVINIHAIKSALANIGEPELSTAALKLEMAGRKRDLEFVLSEIPAFLNALRGVIEKINSEKNNDDDAEVMDENEDDVRVYLCEKLLALQTAAEAFDKLDAEEIVAELRQKKWTLQTDELLNVAAKHLLHSELEEAASITGNYLQQIKSMSSSG